MVGRINGGGCRFCYPDINWKQHRTETLFLTEGPASFPGPTQPHSQAPPSLHSRAPPSLIPRPHPASFPGPTQPPFPGPTQPHSQAPPSLHSQAPPSLHSQAPPSLIPRPHPASFPGPTQLPYCLLKLHVCSHVPMLPGFRTGRCISQREGSFLIRL